MKVYHKALAAMGLCLTMALGMTGCSDAALDGSRKVATVGEKEITLGEANFLLRYQQVQSETYYESMLGEGIYQMDLYGNGKTYGETFKDDVMSQLQQYCIMEEKAADYGIALTEEEQASIVEAAKAFIESNSAETLEQMTADQETVERVLTLLTISTKVSNAISAEADITVTEADAMQRSFEYLSVSKIVDKKEDLTAAIEKIKGGSTLDDVAAELELTASKGNYGPSNASTYPEELINALGGLKEGEVTDLIETDTMFYVAQLTSEYNEEASASVYQSLVSAQQAEYYNTLMTSWQGDYPMTVDEAVWADVIFNRSYEYVLPETAE